MGDFRTNRLPLDHADRRPWVYFLAASTGFIMTSMLRVTVCKLVHTLWPAKDVFAAGIVEVDIRQVEVGQNFVCKWRNEPVFIRRRSPDMIAASQKDDVIVAGMRDPETDAIVARSRSGSSPSVSALTLVASRSRMLA